MAGTIEVLVSGGEADPGPPLGPELGPTPVNVQAVVGEINDQTEAFDGTEVPVSVDYDDDGSFDIDVGVPPTAALVKDELLVGLAGAGLEAEFVLDERRRRWDADVDVEGAVVVVLDGDGHLGAVEGLRPGVDLADDRLYVDRRRAEFGTERRSRVGLPAGDEYLDGSSHIETNCRRGFKRCRFGPPW